MKKQPIIITAAMLLALGAATAQAAVSPDADLKVQVVKTAPQAAPVKVASA